MKRQIRRGVFETNSSSMHSLTVMKTNEKYTSEEILDDLYLYDDQNVGEKECVWKIFSEDDLMFGRMPFRALVTFKDKWLYACASLVEEYNDEVFNDLVAIALKYIPNLKKIELPTITKRFANKKAKLFKKDSYYQEHGKTEKEFLEYLSQKEKEWDTELYYWYNNGWWEFDAPYTGQVDENILSGFLQREKISLEDFLTNKKYVVIQDGDEYCYWKDMKKSGLVNMDIIDHEYPKYDEYGCIEEDDCNEKTNQE